MGVNGALLNRKGGLFYAKKQMVIGHLNIKTQNLNFRKEMNHETDYNYFVYDIFDVCPYSF